MTKHEFKMTNPESIKKFHERLYNEILQTRLNLYQRICTRIKENNWNLDYWIEQKNKMETEYPNIVNGDAKNLDDKINGWY